MATAASSILQPQQQQQGAGETLTSNPEAASTPSAWQSSGSIGPFFAVISVLAVLAVLSCYLGRMWNRTAPTSLEGIQNRGCLGWVKTKCRQCIARDVEHCKVKHGEVPQENTPQV
ncbi:hypothetical protein L6164_014444 [Bauhinia variegata]|uniref:Uncharacterized protein n=1 Tax=Bauhinia variegata TaxID=167791 RepID=A0ACB9NIS3_BAUVA|nr:hypothetical protein L6164_014444 [Bauhinia variegata]